MNRYESIAQNLRSDHGISMGRLHLCLINAVVIGVEAAHAVTGALIPPMLIKYGQTETQMSMILGIGK